MLKPDKWRAAFDNDGKVCGFRQALKLIVLGGVDPTIRPEVWEFLLGCYELNSTTESRRQMRMARRQRYKDLIQQCQMMHSSIGTGSLPYVVGSKVMDVRTLSKDHWMNEGGVNIGGQNSDQNCNQLESYCEWDSAATPNECQRENSSNFTDLVCMRQCTDNATCDSLSPLPTTPNSDQYSCRSLEPGINESYFDFPLLPVTNLFEKCGQDSDSFGLSNDTFSTKHNLSLEEEKTHSFQINNNVHLVMESNIPQSNIFSPHIHSEMKMDYLADSDDPSVLSSKMLYESNELRLGAPEFHHMNLMKSPLEIEPVSRDGISEWLWTLHRIVVDVVRTDNHLEFYEDTKNLARMSDILAIYAWIDPATGYCQGMSDLLSPFIVLYDDNADAFWCFEMLLRRMRQNFHMEGPTGVMKQLEALWHILELIDRDMFAHLSHIGAESLHFAFRMLLVLFRRELSFNEALCMWEMMWAADFDESVASTLEENCLEPLLVQPLLVQIPAHLEERLVNRRENVSGGNSSIGLWKNNVNIGLKSVLQLKQKNIQQSVVEIGEMKRASSPAFCGLTKNFCSGDAHLEFSNALLSPCKGNDELPVFCVGAILIMNRHKITRETHSIDDLIKIFNDNLLKINVKRCVHAAIKIRKRYYCKIIKRKTHEASNSG